MKVATIARSAPRRDDDMFERRQLVDHFHKVLSHTVATAGAHDAAGSVRTKAYYEGRMAAFKEVLSTCRDLWIVAVDDG